MVEKSMAQISRLRSDFWSLNIDPRLFQVLAVGTYAVMAPILSTFERPHYFVLILLAYVVALNALVGKIYYKQVRAPYSAIIIALATSLIMDSPYLGAYLFAATVAVLSKGFFTWKGKHFLNPANSGVVISLLLLPGMSAGIPRLFNFNVPTIFLFIVIGLLVSSYAGSLMIALLWILSFAFFALIRSLVFDTPMTLSFLPMLAPTFFIFTFHMITDPATTPKTTLSRFLFVFLIAGIDAFLRVEFVPFGNFYALFFVSALWTFKDFSIQQYRKLVFHPAVYVIVLLAVLGYYRFQTVDDWYSKGPVFGSLVAPAEFLKEGPENPNSQLFYQAQEQFGLNFEVTDPIVDKKLDKQLRIQWVAPGITVYDFNQDGWMDILAINTSSEAKNALFINQQGKGFVDQAEEWGLAQIPKDLIPQSVTPFDYNRDGLIDLFFSGPGCTHLYKNLGSSFVDVSEEAGARDCGNSIVALPFDFDRDGWMDLYLARFFSGRIDLKSINNMADFGPNNMGQATNGGVNQLYRNVKGQFQPASEVHQEELGSWTWDVGVADLLDDGELVLTVGNDFGDDYYYKVGEKKFIDLTDDIAIRDSRSSMNVSYGFWNNQFPQVVLTNVLLPEFAIRGNFFWQFNPKSQRLIDYQNDRGGADCGWPWGVAFGDFNLDGELDNYMANGMVTRYTAKDNKQGDPNFFKAMTTGQVPPEAWNEGSTSVFKYIDVTKNFAANQRDCLFIKNKDKNSYENLSLLTPAIEKWDSRAVATLDLDNDGILEILVTAQGSPLKLLKSNLKDKHNWIGFNVLTDPALSMGARFKIHQNGQSSYHWYQNGKSGFLAYSDPRVHFGLKADHEPVSLEVRWRDGAVTQHGPFFPGKYYDVKRNP